MEIRKTKLGLHSGELAGRGGGEEGGLHVLHASSVLPCTLPNLDGWTDTNHPSWGACSESVLS